MKSQDIRSAILAIAEKRLLQVGYKKMTIDGLAREAGVGKGSVYLHFSSKEDIVLTLITKLYDTQLANLKAASADSSNAIECLREMLMRRNLFRFKTRFYYYAIDELPDGIRLRISEIRKRQFNAETLIFARVLARGQATNAFIRGDPVDFARTAMLATSSLISNEAGRSECPTRDMFTESTDKLVKLLIRGLEV